MEHSTETAMGTETDDDTRSEHAVVLPERWPSELPLLLLTILTALGIWLLLFVSIIGAAYGVVIGLAMYLAHLAFITHLRGSAIRLGEDQFPDLYRRVCRLSARAGLKRVPEVYLVESGGALNALATKFLGSSIVVLYSSLLEACGDDEAARDMVIAHELAHLRAGHLRFRWLLAPALFTPFPGLVYSRACEFTCDRWAVALTGDLDGALRGITVLAAGGRFSRGVDVAKFARQRQDLNTGFMTVGTWLSTHPPLCRRLEALNPELTSGLELSFRGLVRAALIIVCLFIVPIVGVTILAGRMVSKLDELANQIEDPSGDSNLFDGEYVSSYEDDDGEYWAEIGNFDHVEADLDELAEVVEEFRSRNGVLPVDISSVSAAWRVLRPGVDEPIDPCDGEAFGYTVVAGGGYRLWSCGPDQIVGTDDDLVRLSFSPSVEARCREDLEALAGFVREFRMRNGAEPPDEYALYSLWGVFSPNQPAPFDPFSSFEDEAFGYEVGGGHCVLWSVGPDGIGDTRDDLVVDCGPRSD